jgi:hypothetical protein
MANRSSIEEMAELDSPLFRQSCRDCDFCDGLRDMPTSEKGKTTAESISHAIKRGRRSVIYDHEVNNVHNRKD